MNNLELKQEIDLKITNKIASESISNLDIAEPIKKIIDYIDQEVQGIELLEGPQGAQGPIGVQGVAGPVGPAGLNWQGVWVSGTSYVEDDAVGHNGASWFCINPTSGTTPPNADTTNWALLASQGAQGPQGPPGASGGAVSYTEGSMNTSSMAQAQNPSDTNFKITKNFVRAYAANSPNNFLGLSDVGKNIGSSFLIRNQSNTFPIIIVLIDNARLLGTNGFETIQSFEIKPNTYARFTLVSTTGGSDKVFMVEVIKPLSGAKTTGMLTSNTGTAPFPNSNLDFVLFNSSGSFSLPSNPSLGDVKYIMTTAACTLWASPNPGNDGDNNNILTPSGNGNSFINLTNAKCYRCTYIGRFGLTTGFWTVEIINNI